MDRGVTFCCAQCRLLQAAATACAECGSPMVAPIELVRELLTYRDMRIGSERDWGMLAAMLTGSSLALPILAPFAIASLGALGVHKLRTAWRRKAIAGVDLVPPAAPLGASYLFGTARRLHGTIASLGDRRGVLAEHAVVKDRRGAVLVRRSEATAFLVDTDDRGPVLVTGVTRVVTPGVPERVKRGDPRIRRMGIPDSFAIAGALEVSSVADGGARIVVAGIVADESVPEFAFHRDGGQVSVMRGRVGAPILIKIAAV